MSRFNFILLHSEERLIFGRSLGSGPWLMPRELPTHVAAIPTLLCKKEGLLEISFKETIGDVDTLIRTSYGSRDMTSLKLFLKYGEEKEVHSRAADIEASDDKDSKFFRFPDIFAFPTPPNLEDGALPPLEIILKEPGTMRAHELEKQNLFFEGWRLQNRGFAKLIHYAAQKGKKYRTVLGRSTPLTIDTQKLLASKDYEMDIPVTIHARVDMGLLDCKPKEGSRRIETTIHVKWTPPVSPSPPSCSAAPLAVLPPMLCDVASVPAIKSKKDDATVYEPASGNVVFEAEGLTNAMKLVESNYEKDAIGPRTTSAIDAPPVKRVCAIYGINLPTAVSAVCCRAPGFVAKKGMIMPRYVMDKSAFLIDKDGFKKEYYEIDDGMINELPSTPQKDLLTGNVVNKSGDGTVPYHSLQQPQVWKRDGLCDEVRIEEIDGAEHREILINEKFHDILLSYVTGSYK